MTRNTEVSHEQQPKLRKRSLAFSTRMQAPRSPQHRGGPLAPQAGGSLPLSVVMGPQRARTTISFQPREGLSNGSSQRPTLTVFAHEPGSRVHKDLFPVYQLPNGQLGFMYYNAGRVQVRTGCPCLCMPAASYGWSTLCRGYLLTCCCSAACRP